MFADFNVTVENLRQFVRRHSNVYMALKGCLQVFDELATEFVRAVQGAESTQSEQLAKILQRAEDELEKLENDKVGPAHVVVSLKDPQFYSSFVVRLKQDKASGKVYILFMKRIEEKGLGFVSGESKRLQHLLSGKISDNKKAELNQKLNILSAFNHDDLLRANSLAHTEL